MRVDLLVHVNTLPGGHVVATPVHLPGIADTGDDERAVLAHIARRAADITYRVATRRPLFLPTHPSLHQIVAHLRLEKGSEERLPVRLSAVVLEPAEGGGEAGVVAVAPAVNVRIMAQTPQEALERLAAACAKALSKWPADDALGAELVGEVALRTVAVDLKEAGGQGSGDDTNRSFLAQYGEELTANAAVTSVDERGELFERMLATLALPERSSVMLVGPPEVGKTALIRELALRLREGRVPLPLQGRELWALPVNDLIAGARYTGMWQDRAHSLARAARERRAIVAVGDPAAIIDAGRWSGSDNNVGRMLRPHIESGAITLICEATPEQVEAARKVEASFVDAFHRIDVVDPGPELTQRILAGAARRLKLAQQVEIDPDALTTAVDLTRRFEPYRGFPGKAVRLIEEAVGDGGRRITREDVVRCFTTRTGLPLALLSDQEPLSPGSVEEHFGARVLGQPEAVQAMVDLVMVVKAGLNAPGKPLGVYLFVGPTGVGKTELAKALAELLFGSRDRVLRFDMGEHATGDAVPRLLGSAWIREDEGELTRRVREQPFCVVLLDEIEKAHRLVFDALLAAIGEGRLTDAAGRTADFRNAIVIMTSNLGARARDAPPLGFSSGDESAGRLRRVRYYDEQVEEFFRPEFVNRLDRVIVFNPLEEETVRRIVRRDLGRLLMREGIMRRQLLVEVTDEAVEQLATRAFHPRYGARPLQREIERLVIQPLARRIVEGRCGPGDVVRIASAGPKITVDLQRVTTPRPRPTPPRASEVPRTAGGLARALVAGHALRKRLESDAATPIVRGAREELSGHVDRTRDPAFWDDPEQARATLSRVYELQRPLDALAALRERAEGLLEMGRQMQNTGDRTRLGELRGAIEEIESRRGVVRLELAALAGAGDHPTTVLRVSPVAGSGDAARWAPSLLKMYAGWAARNGRTATAGPDGGSLTIEGASTFDLLAGERGLHRWVPKAREAHASLARVAIEGLDGPEAVVVRIYDEGRDQVRDPRTGTQVRKVPSVLSGGIDEFLISEIAARTDR